MDFSGTAHLRSQEYLLGVGVMVVVVHRDVVVGGGAFPDGNVAACIAVARDEGLVHRVGGAQITVAIDEYVIGGVGVKVREHELGAVNRHRGVIAFAGKFVPDGITIGAKDGGLPAHQCGIGGDLADVDIQRC